VSPLASTGGGPLSGLIVAGVAILVVGIMALVATRRRPRKS
jgi:LPXTG-motif cell wall-anchored protein